MTKFTREVPFKFDGGTGYIQGVYTHVDNGTSDLMVCHALNGTRRWVNISRQMLAACNAFIEAENNEWRWTNDDYTEARKGRWVVTEEKRSFLDVRDWAVGHDDMPGGFVLGTAQDPDGMTAQVVAKSVHDDFLAWSAEQRAQEQPSEPTGYGHVGSKDEKDVFRSKEGSYSLISRDTGNYVEGLTWAEVCKFDGEFKEARHD